MTAYQYNPLGPNDIRLLLVNPGKLGSSIDCEIQHHSVDHAPPYSALSYCWGSPVCYKVLNVSKPPSREKTKSIFARLRKSSESSKLLITESLHAALNRIRRHDQTVLLWADAVCINQKDVAEKSAQVQLMHQIYRRASQTLIYVGEDADDSRLVPRLVKQILDTGLQPLPTLYAMVSKDLPPKGDVLWSAWDAFFRRPWFHRVWVLQEVALASRAVVLCGDWRLDFADVVSAVASPVEQWTKANSKTAHGRTMANVMGTMRKRALANEPMPLLGLIHTGQSAQATEPIDHLYSVLGLSMEADISELAPDYSETITDTLRRYVKFFVASGQGMHLISYVNCETWRSDHPTWFPYWASHTETRDTWGYLRQNSRHYPFKAAGETQYHMTHVDVVENNINWLVLKGVAIDTIYQLGTDHRSHDCGEPMNDEIFDHPMGTMLLEPEYLDVISKDADPTWRSWYNTEMEWYEAKWQTVVAGTIEPEDVPNEFARWTYANCYTILTRKIPGPGTEYPNDRFAYYAMLYDYFNQITSTQAKLMLCTTRMNGWLGAVPYGTQTGDIVVLFLGAQVPFVLRRRPEGEIGYLVVGACYMHGIMRGELAGSLHEEDNPAMQDWVLS